MLRDVAVNEHKVALATYKAAAAMKTGMAVVKGTDGTVSLATGADNLFFVQKARVPSGANAAYTNLSDYTEEYNTVAAGDLVVLYSYDRGELFATDAFDALTGLSEGDAVTFTAGKLGAGEETGYIYRGEYNDAGHTLALIERIDAVVE